MVELDMDIAHALLFAAWMAWQVGWSLVLGFLISAVLQGVVSRERITAALGRDGPREIALATVAGAASSSCSYASAAITRSLLEKGAALIPSLAFLLASTNLVVELGIVLWLLMGWQFMAGEWLGGIVLVLVMSLIVRATYPKRLFASWRLRAHPGHHAHHHHDHAAAIAPKSPSETLIRIAQHFAMDWGMLWKDLVLGFLIAGALAAFVPDGLWSNLFVRHAPAWLQVPANALIGPLIGILSFVCSIGNVPMAAVLWGSGVSFGGVLAFLYSDLIVLPLLDVYRRAFGLKFATYIGAVFYAAMVAAAIAMDAAFTALGWIPATRPHFAPASVHFALNYTTWLNLAALAIAAGLFAAARIKTKAPPPACAHCGGGK